MVVSLVDQNLLSLGSSSSKVAICDWLWEKGHIRCNMLLLYFTIPLREYNRTSDHINGLTLET